MSSENGNLYYGEDGTEHEYAIIGDEDGLKKLRSACDEALKSGEFCGAGLGDFTGVKKVESETFEDIERNNDSTDFIGVVILVVIIAIFVFAAVGVFATIKWIF